MRTSKILVFALLGVASTAGAEPVNPWQFGVAPRLGFVVPTSKLGAMVVGGLELDVALPPAHHQLILALDVSLTRPSYDDSTMDPRVPGGTAMYTIHETELVIGATIGYRFFGVDKPLIPWVAVGPLLHLLKTSETTSLSPGDNTATSTEVGVEVAAGVDYHAGPGYLLGGLRWTHSSLDHLFTGASNAGKVGLELGYRLVF